MQNEVLPDRFVVCGEGYKELRELTAEIVLGKDVGALAATLEVNSTSLLWLVCNVKYVRGH